MQKIPTVVDFNQTFPIGNEGFRLTKSKVKIIREALGRYHAAYATRHHIREQVKELIEISRLAKAYCRSKASLIPEPEKARYMRALHTACDTLVGQIYQHAQRAQTHFTAGHHAAQLPTNARHAAQRISTGVGLLPDYRLEQYTAKYGPSQRMHGGTFLTSKGMHHVDFNQMDAMDIYALIKEFKHVNHNAIHLDYFDDPARARKKLTRGPDHTVLLDGVPADTTGQVEKKVFANNGALTNPNSGRFYQQDSGGNDGYAIYACSLDGDFYVHLDLQDHAGSYQHSSILAGAQVTCAGTIYCVKGRVCILSNNSGHYQPTAADLHDAMVAMRDDLGVNPKTVLITCKNTQGNYYLCTGETLLTLGVGQGIESLPAAACVAWHTNPNPSIRSLSITTLTTWAVNEEQDQSKTIAKIMALAWSYKPQAR